MPELPEVETIRLTLLHKNIIGKKIKKVYLPPSRLLREDIRIRKPFISWFTGETLTGLERWGKYLMLRGKQHALILHFGMSGVLHWQDHPSPPPPHLDLCLSFNNEEGILFSDPRTFGRLIPLPHLSHLDSIKNIWKLKLNLGPDALLTPTPDSARSCWEKTSKSIRSLKSILLDQRVLAGVGNIYADESLFRSRLSPQKVGSSLTLDQWRALIANLKKVFRKALRAGGSTLNDYRRPDGLEGKFQSQFTVYGRGGEPCSLCERPLEKIVIQARSTVYCPHCQR